MPAPQYGMLGGSSACDRKNAYRSRKIALNRAAVCRKISGIELRVYKCLVCHSWHLTHWV